MHNLILDGEEMTSKEGAHQHLAVMMDFPQYYGENLDALWDLLTVISEPTQITLINGEKLIQALGDYGEAIISIFEEAAAFNHKLSFFIENCPSSP
jgi:ribonuclease inhibitor